ncbi:MAG: hypothetical protein JNG88_16010 [Phycisphaerales bacterium]|nr:hypothetical protein [Phycisphaerales bacterium]
MWGDTEDDVSDLACAARLARKKRAQGFGTAARRAEAGQFAYDQSDARRVKRVLHRTAKRQALCVPYTSKVNEIHVMRARATHRMIFFIQQRAA